LCFAAGVLGVGVVVDFVVDFVVVLVVLGSARELDVKDPSELGGRRTDVNRA